MNSKVLKRLPIILGVVILMMTAGIFAGKMIVNANTTDQKTSLMSKEVTADGTDQLAQTDENELAAAALASSLSSETGSKAYAAALAVGIAAAAGAIAMGIAIAKSAEGISRQPEAEGSIRTTLMLGLVFIETAIIYALIVAILIIFVM